MRFLPYQYLLFSGLLGLGTATVHAKPHLEKMPAEFRFSVESVHMPSAAPSMGLLGFSYLLHFNSWFSAGLGTYSAVTGTMGGLFTVGIETDLHHKLFQRLEWNSGLFVGGGGRSPKTVGGGFMLRPFAGIDYCFDAFKLGLAYSWVVFPSGTISSSQLAFNIDIPTAFYFLRSQGALLDLESLSDVKPPDTQFLHFSHSYFSLIQEDYFQQKGTRGTDGRINDGTLKLLGFEFGHYWNSHWFWSVKTAGAFHGSKHGYMDAFWGLGYGQRLSSFLEALVQLNLGAGGGGNIETGGGFALNPIAGVNLFFTSSFAAQIAGGYITAPGGNLRAGMLALKLLYFMNTAVLSNAAGPTGGSSPYFLSHLRFRIMNQTYFGPLRTARTTRSNINLIALQPDYFLNPYLYLTGQGAAAYQGDQSGGLASGLVGLGLQTRYFKNIAPYFEFLIGAEGGGGLDLGSGAIIQSNLGLQLRFNNYVGAFTSGGWLKALQGSLSIPTLYVGLTFSFDKLNAH